MRKTFGLYELKCPTAERLRSTSGSAAPEKEGQKPEGKRKRKQKAKRKLEGPRMEISRLTDDESALVGELILPGVLEAGIILAATKKGLEKLIRQAEDNDANKETTDLSKNPQEERQTEAEGEGEVLDSSGPGVDDEDSGGSASSEDKERRRFDKFEKNSFRQPKFWLWWKGKVHRSDLGTSIDPEEESGMGYVVFSGNSCRKLEGTLSCASLQWENVAFSGQ